MIWSKMEEGELQRDEIEDEILHMEEKMMLQLHASHLLDALAIPPVASA